jgi:hypothetical protein
MFTEPVKGSVLMKKVYKTYLNRLLNGGFDKVLLDLGTNVSITGSITTVKSEERLNIELGALEDLDLADVDVLQGEDTLASLLNTVTNDILGNGRRRGDELGNELLEIARSGFLGHDLEHLLADLTDLGRLSIGGLLDLVAATSSEGNDEKTDKVTVGGLDINESLQERLPLLDEGTELIRGEVHSVEVGEAVLALNFINSQLDLAESTILILGKIAERDFDNTTLKVVVGVLLMKGERKKKVFILLLEERWASKKVKKKNFNVILTETLGTVDKSLTDLTNIEHGRSLDVIPVLAGEGVNARDGSMSVMGKKKVG